MTSWSKLAHSKITDLVFLSQAVLLPPITPARFITSLFLSQKTKSPSSSVIFLSKSVLNSQLSFRKFNFMGWLIEDNL